jgi:hypothetical protein
MSHHLKAVAAMPGWNSGLGVARLNRRVCALALTSALVGCGSPASRDVLACDACITRLRRR